MKVFLSWSGPRSKALAEVMRVWLPSVLQAVRPYFSPDDVSKGARWSSDIAKELEASRVALLFITADNPEAPWLVFEAGALSKNLESSKVCPLLFGDIELTDIKGPLTQFQGAKFGKDEMLRALRMINKELGEANLAETVLESVFDKWWPDLEEQVSQALARTAETNQNSRRDDRDLLEEILLLARRNQRPERQVIAFNHPAVRDLARETVSLLLQLRSRYPNAEIVGLGHRILGPLNYVLSRGAHSDSHAEVVEQFRDLQRELEAEAAMRELESIDERERENFFSALQEAEDDEK